MDGEREGGHDDGGDGGGEGAKYRGNDDRSVGSTAVSKIWRFDTKREHSRL